jgi:CDP-diacylglycerol--glycerol-3-phosphate 3-phosphatidyltransferase
MNTPNVLTCSRLVLTAIFLYFLSLHGFAARASALSTFLLATLTDYWDGRLARERGEVTRFGKLMDPIADKALTLAAFGAFAWLELIPVWMVALIVARDLGITAFRLQMADASGHAQEARWSGKAKTSFQFLAIVSVLGYLVVRETPAWHAAWDAPACRAIFLGMLAVTAFTLWTGLHYFRKSRPRA